jgi:hypothetical protein
MGSAELNKAGRPNVSVVDKLLLASWVYSYAFILWCFKLVSRLDSAQVPPATRGGATPS